MRRIIDWSCPYCSFSTTYKPNYTAHITIHQRKTPVSSENEADGVNDLLLSSGTEHSDPEQPTK